MVMKRLMLPRFLVLYVSLCIFLNPLTLPAQESKDPKNTKPTPEEISGEGFTQFLKQIWSFLKDETDKFTEASKKSQFETSSEYDRRMKDLRRKFGEALTKYGKDEKLKEQIFVLSFKASLEKYEADSGMYILDSKEMIDIPYNIPAVRCIVRTNPFVALSDSIRKGYRISSLFLNFRPDFRIKMTRENAKVAKENEGEIYFNVHLMVDVESSKDPSAARLTIIPKKISLLNKKENYVYWDRQL